MDKLTVMKTAFELVMHSLDTLHNNNDYNYSFRNQPALCHQLLIINPTLVHFMVL